MKLQENNQKKKKINKNKNQQETFSELKMKPKKLGVRVTKDRIT